MPQLNSPGMSQGFSEVDIIQPTKAHRAECHHHSWRNCRVLEGLTLEGSNYSMIQVEQTQTHDFTPTLYAWNIYTIITHIKKYEIVAGRAGAEVSKKTNEYKKPMVYWNVCEMQKQWTFWEVHQRMSKWMKMPMEKHGMNQLTQSWPNETPNK